MNDVLLYRELMRLGVSDYLVPPLSVVDFVRSLSEIFRAPGAEPVGRTIAFVGIASNVCVESTLRDAFHLEYFAVMIEDATHHLGPDYVRDATVYNVEKFFGWVSDVADFCGSIGQRPQEE